jgi:hypothetical protein
MYGSLPHTSRVTVGQIHPAPRLAKAAEFSTAPIVTPDLALAMESQRSLRKEPRQIEPGKAELLCYLDFGSKLFESKILGNPLRETRAQQGFSLARREGVGMPTKALMRN